MGFGPVPTANGDVQNSVSIKRASVTQHSSFCNAHISRTSSEFSAASHPSLLMVVTYTFTASTHLISINDCVLYRVTSSMKPRNISDMA
jgi:hypothetical protein